MTTLSYLSQGDVQGAALAAFGMMDIDHLRGENATVDLTYTYANSKWMCHRAFYFAHIYWVYMIMFTGMACFITIMVPPLKWLHAWFGRMYIFSMIMATATALLIFNSGLPEAVLWSFLWTNLCLAAGWILIKFHQANLHNAALALVETRLSKGALDEASFRLGEAVMQAKKEIGWAKTASQRFLSIKALHGVCMFVSVFGLAGRVFFSNQSGDFTCYTYPIFKPVNANHKYEDLNLAGKSLQQIPLEDPLNADMPWTKLGGTTLWGIMLFSFPVACAVLFGLAFTCWAAKRENKMMELKKEAVALS